jgi:hypothetical protein
VAQEEEAPVQVSVALAILLQYHQVKAITVAPVLILVVIQDVVAVAALVLSVLMLLLQQVVLAVRARHLLYRELANYMQAAVVVVFTLAVLVAVQLVV